MLTASVAPDSRAQGWYDSAWRYRKQITIDHTKVGATGAPHSDFPVLVSLASDADLSANARADGFDILFTAADGVTKLNHDRESYGGGALVAWVSIPSLSASADTRIYMFYGNASATDQQNRPATWNVNFKGVWHLNEATGATVRDATSNSNDGSPAVGLPTSTAGKIGGALDFAVGAVGVRIEIPADPSLDVTQYGTWTMSGWVKPTSYVGVKWPTVYGYSVDATLGLAKQEAAEGRIEHWQNDSTFLHSNNSATLNAWNHIAIVRDPVTTRLYLNGVLDGSGASVGINGPGRSSAIGSTARYPGDDDLLGVIDEVRLSNVGRSSQWLVTEYNNQSSPSTFYLVGAQETASTIAGAVFEDVNYGGGAGRDRAAASGVPRPGARVELYNGIGTFTAFAISDASGVYAFTGLAAGNYTVRVVNATVTSSRVGYAAALRAVQTYRTDATSGIAIPMTDHVGGENPSKVDAGNGSTTLAALNTATTTAQSVTAVNVGSADVSGVDFGLNFNTIVNKNDAGQGSLRQFMTNASALSNTGLSQAARTAGIDNAIFMLADGTARPGTNAGYASLFVGGVATIAPTSALPTITDPAILDAQTQPRWTLAPIVELSGAGAGDGAGLTIRAGSSTVRGFVINRFRRNGIAIQIGGGNTIAGNYIGVDASGTAASANQQDGIYIEEAPDNLVGGATPADRNIVSGNMKSGISVWGTGSTGNVIQGNHVGVNVVGNAAIPNKVDGVGIDGGASGTTVGGAAAGAGNVISGNSSADGDGIWIQGGSGNVILGNKIGVNAAGNAPIPNGWSGIYIDGSSGNTIGGTGAGEGNVIASSASDAGVALVNASQQNAIRGNSIYGNTRLGIDLKDDGVTVNDTNDADTGPNGLLNFPVLESAHVASGSLSVQGWARPGSAIDLYVADPDLTVFGEGRTFLAALTEGSADDLDAGTGAYANPVNGLNQGSDTTNRFSFSIPVPAGVGNGTRLTATATAGGSTSEFCGNLLVLPTIAGRVLEDVDGDGGLGDAVAAAGVRIRLYADNNNDGIVGAGDAFVVGTVTDAAGAYRLQPDPVVNGVRYLVTVDSVTVAPSAGFNGGWTQGDVWAEQTYGDDPTTSVLDLGPRFGGRNPAVPDRVDPAVTTTAASAYEHLARVDLSQGDVGGVDFGFSFKVITHTLDGPDAHTGGNRTRQGSLRQLIQNANAMVGEDRGKIPPGTYVLSIPGSLEDLSRTGDLDVTDDLVLEGAGRALTVVDGGGIDRVLHVPAADVFSASGITIRNGDADKGAGVLNQSGLTTLTDVTVSGNHAAGRGGGILTQNAGIVLNDVLVAANRSDSQGGGVANQAGTAILTDVTIRGNTAAGGGGGMLTQSGTSTLQRVTISGNTAADEGGGFFCQAGISDLTNVTLSDNTATNGGGYYNGSGISTLTNVTVSFNKAATSASGLYAAGGAGSLTVANTIVSNPSSVPNCSGPLVVGQFNLDSGNSCGFNGPGQIKNRDPLLGPLQNNGGPTETHALLAGSPAIDAGNDAGCPAVDQRGVTRPIDGDADGTPTCDMGAVEFNGTLASTDLSITKDDGVATYTPGTTVTYTIEVSNEGPTDVVGARFTDVFPPAITGATWSCAASPGASCPGTGSGTGNINEIFTLAKNESLTYTVTATIASSVSGNLVNTASVSTPAGILDSVPGNNTASDTDAKGTSVSDLGITKTDGVASYTPGGSLTYAIVVTNAGPSDAIGATVKDVFPADIASASWVCVAPPGASCTPSGSGNIDDAIQLPAGKSLSYTVTAVVSQSAAGSIANSATVAAPADGTDPDPGNNAASDTDAAGGRISDLGVTKTDDAASYTPGGSLTYAIVVSNAGPSNVSGATVTDTLPALIASATWSCVAAVGSSCTASGSGDIADSVTIPVGSSVTYTVAASVSPAAIGPLANTASIAAPAGTVDPDPVNNSATDTDAQGTSSADLSITKTDAVASYAPGGSLTYAIVVSNAGPASVSGATVTDTFPGSIASATWSCVAPVGASCTASGSGSIADSVTIPAGSSVTYTVNASVSPSASGPLVNTASVAVPAGAVDPTSGNNSEADTDAQGTSSADLSITKTDGVASYVAGGSVVYTIVVSNSGPASVSGATVFDTLPALIASATWSCVAPVGASCTAIGSGSIADSVTISAGASVTYTVSADVSPSATGPLANTASVSAPAGAVDPDPGNNSATDTDAQGTSSADLSITKTDAVASYAPGGSLTYTIVVSNAGPASVSGATVMDTFPGSIASATWSCVTPVGASCTASGSGSIADSVTIPAGSSVTYTVNASVSPSASGPLTNTASVSAPAGAVDPDPVNNSATDTDAQGTSSADLSITKTDAVASYAPGGSLTYMIVVSNAGPASVSGATVTDTFPGSIASATWSCVAPVGASCTASGSGSIADSVTIPAGSSVTYTVNASVSPSASGPLTNTASVSAPAGAVDPDPGNNSATDTDAQGTSSADLSITKTDAVASYAPGGSLTYAIVVSNAGPASVSGATVTDTFPGSIASATWSCVAPVGASCTASGSGSIADSVTIPAGNSVTYTVNASVLSSASGPLTNTASVAAPAGAVDPDPVNNSATDTDAQGTSSADLSITKTDAVASYAPGGSLTYAIVVSNAGPASVSGATVTDTFPGSIASATWSCVAPVGASCTASGSGSIADSVTIPAGSSVTYTVNATVSPSASGPLTNTASVSAPAGASDPNPGNNSATDTDVQGASTADFSVTKTDGVASYVPGASLTYAIVVSNAGPASVSGATVTDTLPASIASATWSCVAPVGASCTASGSGSITDSVTIPAGSSVTYTVNASVSPSATGPLANTASVAVPAGVADPNPGNDSATDTDAQGISSADLSLTNTVDPTAPPVGSTVVFTLTVSNAGPSDASGVQVSDPLPSGYEYVGHSGPGTYSPATGTWDVGAVPRGTGAQLRLTARVLEAGDHANAAQISSANESDPNSTPGNGFGHGENDESVQAVSPVQVGALAITKTAGKTEVIVGEVVPYAIAIRNVGDIEAQLVRVEDRLPAGFSYVPGSARLDGAPMPEPSGGEPLVFEIGTVPLLLDTNGNGTPDPGEVGYRELTYRLAVGSGALPGTHTNRAIARQPCDDCTISNEAVAVVNVRLDPVLDYGLIIGKVFDDRNANAMQDPGEAGVRAARVALDDGTYALTDEFGRYHLPALEPGQRLLKIDVRSLPPGSSSPDPLRVVWLTPGLMATADFGVTIPQDLVEIGRPATPGLSVTAEDRKLPVEVQGNADTLAVFVDGQRVLLNAGDARIELEALAPILRLAEDRLDRPIVFRLDADSAEQIAQWELTVQDKQERLVRRFAGEGGPPRTLEWDGRAEDGTMALRGGVFEYFLIARWKEGGRTRGPIRYFGVDRAQIIALQLTGEAFRFGGDELSDRARHVLARAAATLRKHPNDKIVIEGHTDSVGSREANLDLSRRRAQSALDHLVKVEGLPGERFELQAFGEERPVASNDFEEGRALNRRIVIRGDLEEVDPSSIVDIYRAPPYVTVNGAAAKLGSANDFMQRVEGDEIARVDIEVADSLGRLSRAAAPVPMLTITAPKGEFVVPAGGSRNGCRFAEGAAPGVVCRIEGATEVGNAVEILGRTVTVDPEGRFTLDLPLDVGSNQIDVLARNPQGFRRAATLRVAVADRDAEGRRISVDAGVPALSVQLPPSGTKLASSPFAFEGRTDPGNQVTANDQPVAVGPDGRFATSVDLPAGRSRLVVRVTSPEGGVGTVERELEVPKNQIFLLAFADGKIGQIHGSGALEPAVAEDGLFAEGRLAFYLKGTIAGKYLITSALDTGKGEAEYLFRDLDVDANDRLLRNLDPDKDYPVYGDSGTVVYDAESSGKFFLALDGDEMHAVVGNYPIALTETELAAYRRTTYGARFAYVTAARSSYGAPDTEVVLFASEVRRAHVRDELRATGGSLYYLSHPDLVEGSEHVVVVVRDKITGLTLTTETQVQNVDYTIKYPEGRILFHRPLASVAEGGSLVNQDILGGHPVFVRVDYDARLEGLDESGYGARARRQIGDHLAVGGTYVKDQADSGPYELAGVDAEVRLKAGTRIVAERAESSGSDARTLVSDDGGVSYVPAPGAPDREGAAWKLAADVDIGEWFAKPDRFRVGAYFKDIDPSFVSNGNSFEQGTRKVGFHADLRLTEHDSVGLRHDREDLAAGTIREQQTSSVQWQRKHERWGVAAEYFAAARTDAAGSSADDSTLLAARGWWKALPTLSARLDQQTTLSGPSNDQTTLGLTFQPFSWLALDVSGTHGSIGDSAQAGAAWTGKGGEIYVTERLADERAARRETTVVGARAPIGPASKAYAEYQWEDAAGGGQMVSLFGIQRQWDPAEGMRFVVSGEAANVASDTTGGRRRAVHTTFSYVRPGALSAVTSNSLRLDTRDGGKDLEQWVSATQIDCTVSPDLTLLARYRYSRSEDRNTGLPEARFDERSLGVAYRPVAHQRFQSIFRLTRLFDERPEASGGSAEGTTSSVVSLDTVYRVAPRVAWLAKEAFRTIDDAVAEGDGRTQLFIQRLDLEVRRPIVVGIEYRLLQQTASDDSRRGFLVDAGWRLHPNFRVGLGFNFTSFSDNLEATRDENAHGWFVRVQGIY